MANIQQDPSSGRYRIKFRYGGVEYQRSIKTTERRAAESVRARAEETLRLLFLGRLELPEGADLPSFVLSDGERTGRPETKKTLTLGGLIRLYRDTLPLGAKEASTISCEETHFRHLLAHIPANRSAQSLTVADLQRYADARARQTWRGKAIGPDTVKKELATFRAIWNWAAERGHLSGPAPIRGVRLAKPDEKPPFMTWEEIERAIARGGRPEELWPCLFLDVAQVEAVLAHVREAARRPFILPMFAFAAYTGARRSEILRSKVGDFDFRSGVVHIREKKKSRSKAVTYRHVDLTPAFEAIMRDWFAAHPGGAYAICDAGGEPLTANEAVHYFRLTLDGSAWEPVRGFHVFRHSFASNCAAAGVDQRVIDAFLGHQTEEMRKRYRHLFPGQRRQALLSVFG